ncbi:MAG: hypothetical protein CVT80_12740, partial [Alphaproteobacteria bacterium HGW-Alphaproteobacteria-2]
MALEVRAGAARALVSGPGVPLGQVSLTAADSLLRLDMPQVASGLGMPFDLALTVARLMPGPEHLAPGSAAAELAEGGVQAELALTGRLSPVMGAPPPAIEALNLDRLRVSFADAVLSGSGALTQGDGAGAA